jgi:hypothetical protein
MLSMKQLQTITAMLLFVLIAFMFVGGDNPGNKVLLAMRLTLLAMFACGLASVYIAYRANQIVQAAITRRYDRDDTDRVYFEIISSGTLDCHHRRCENAKWNQNIHSPTTRSANF